MATTSQPSATPGTSPAIHPKDQSFAIVGAGRLGTALGVLMQRAGYKIAGFSTRSRESLEVSSHLLGFKGSSEASEAADNADCVVLSVPDDAIASVCEELCEKGVVGVGSRVIHTSGSQGLSPLSSAVRLGADVLAVHVLQSVPSATDGIERIPGSWFGVTCSDDQKEWAGAFVKDLGGLIMFLTEEDRSRYHLAAVFASNFLVTLADLSGATFEGVEPYLPLMEGTLANIAALGTEKALTGPVVRGDAGTVKRHLQVIKGETELACYRALTKATIDLAVRSGRVSEDSADEMRKVLL